MKLRILLITLLAFNTFIFSQTKQEEKIKDFFWGENDAHKDATDVPEKWKKESAVILYKNQNYDFHKFARNVTYTTSLRKRIKLLDKSAVKEFSEFSFSDLFKPPKKAYILLPIAFNIKQKPGTYVGIKVVKPDGKEIEVDIEEEGIQEDGKTKIAISNLEVGDIIDYYVYKEEEFKSHFAFGFDPVETTLAEDYPIVDFKLFFETENDFFINFNSYNGAPDLELIPTEKKSFRRYSLETSNIDKYSANRWFYPLVELPSYKFQVYFARSGKFENQALAFLPEKEKIIKKSVSSKEILDLYDKRFKASGDLDDLKDFFKGKTFKNDTEKVISAFYYMRHYYLTRFVEAMYMYDSRIAYNAFSYYGNNPVFIQNDKQFIRHFTAFLKRHKIDSEIVVAKKRYDGSIDDLLIESNVNVLLKVNTPEPLYVEFFGPHTTVNGFSSLLEGTDVYLLSASKNKIDKITRNKLPISNYADNENKRDVTLTIDDDFNGVTIKAVNSFKGQQKKDQQKDRLLFTEYTEEDYKKYKTKSFIERVKRKKDKIDFRKKLDALIEDLKQKQIEKFEEQVKNEYDVKDVDNYTFTIDSLGRYDLNSYFTYTETFNAKNALIKKAGPNYIVEIGKLLTAQIDLTEKQRNRNENIHMPFARCYNNSIRFNIPDGYTAVGIDKFEKSIENETGAFHSKAKIEGNKLIIETSKQYKNNYEPNSNWSLMTEFLDAAHKFTNEKILLKKA